MSEIDFRYGRVWFGDAPENASFVPTDFKVGSVDQLTFSSEPGRSICLHLFLPGLGDSSGTLGAQFTPLRQKETLIRVAFNHSESPESLISGLTEEMADRVLTQAVKELTHKNLLGSGQLFFNQARYHPMYATPFIFRILTTSLIWLLSSGIPQTDDDMTATIKAVIKSETHKNTGI